MYGNGKPPLMSSVSCSVFKGAAAASQQAERSDEFVGVSLILDGALRTVLDRAWWLECEILLHANSVGKVFGDSKTIYTTICASV